jgi:cytochrome c-type biogenesis protein CcmF
VVSLFLVGVRNLGALFGYWMVAFAGLTILWEFGKGIRARMQRGEGPVIALVRLVARNRRRHGGYVVHFGVVLIMVGTAGSVLNQEVLQNLSPGDEMSFRDYRLEYLTADPIPAQHYGGAVARLALYRGDDPLGVMTPEKRMYWLEQQPSSIPSVHSTLREDLYVILTSIERDGSATFKIYRNPLVNWIWIGSYVFLAGSVAVLWPQRARTSEPGSQ